jgi:hypothetical protein
MSLTILYLIVQADDGVTPVREFIRPFVFENLDPSFVRARSIQHLSIISGKLENGRLICAKYDGNSVPQKDA